MNNTREKNPNWQGGRTTTSHGYVLVKVEKGHHLAHATGYAYEHRLVVEQKLGRRLKPSELVHHKDEVRDNNDPANLEVEESIAHHKAEHRTTEGRRLPGEDNPLIICACGCGEELNKYDDTGRPRKYATSHSWRKGIRGFDVELMTVCECGCGSEFTKYDKYGRTRRFVSGHNARRCHA